MREQQNILQRADKPLMVMYLMLLIFGALTVFAVNYEPGNSSFFDLSLTHGRQMIWMFISVLLGLSMLTFNSNFFTKLSIPFYVIMVVLLLITLAVAREINGARSWLQIGPVQFQPAEFAKTATALMLAKYISGLKITERGIRYKFIASVIILLPMLIIVLQQDVGSALVYVSLSLVLYREGFAVREVIVGLLFGVGFVCSLIFDVQMLLWLFSVAAVIYVLLSSEKLWRKDAAKAAIFTLFIALFFAAFILAYYAVPMRFILLSGSLVLLVIAGLTIRNSKHISVMPAVFMYAAITAFSVYGTAMVMNDILQPHQSQRVLTLFGLSDDPDANYNVTQSKMTIGSGGLAGKGYLQGTLTQLKHVPEQTTDFIFCTIGEELGFIGTALFILLYTAFILRLTFIAERQRSPFTRIYCYAVAAIFFIQILINVGMTIGLVPVIGIPLPFISYGGSSVLAFSIMVFIVLRLDADRLLILR